MERLVAVITVPVLPINVDKHSESLSKMPEGSEGQRRKKNMLGHMSVNVHDLAQAKVYYDTLMPLLGFEPYKSAADQFAYRPAGGRPGTYIFFYPALAEGAYSRHCPGLQHLA